ncbi:MAG: AAA family ATPase [Gammaproteobacteria bacterium]|nr:AAA family ATPase [Gammaproteobacteria bacterium]
MYESFYGLKEKPFSLLPDPAFLYLSRQHEMAITLLEYSLENQAGFCVITGKAGTGKTTLLRRLLNQIGEDVSIGLITNTHHSFGELLRWILHSFSLDDSGSNRARQHQVFVDYLIGQYSKNRRTMLIIDEAQNMSPEALEELRMLSNINSEKDLLLQVILVGQPPLREVLRRPELEQFAQRVAVDYHLDPLNGEETCGYIRHRLLVAGGERELFTDDACKAVFVHSGGIPRLINLLCDLALVYAYAEHAAVITGELIEQIVSEREKHGVFPVFAVPPELSALHRPLPKHAHSSAATDMSDTAATRIFDQSPSQRLAGEARHSPAAGKGATLSPARIDVAGKDRVHAARASASEQTRKSAATPRATTVMEDAKTVSAPEALSRGGVVQEPAHSPVSGQPAGGNVVSMAPVTAVKVAHTGPGSDVRETNKPGVANDVRQQLPAKPQDSKIADAPPVREEEKPGLLPPGHSGTGRTARPRRFASAIAIILLVSVAAVAWLSLEHKSLTTAFLDKISSVRVTPPTESAGLSQANAAPEGALPMAAGPKPEASSMQQTRAIPPASRVETDKETKLRHIEQERDAVLAIAEAAERERDALRRAALARERAMTAEHEAALARERERADELARAAEMARQQALAAAAAAEAKLAVSVTPPPVVNAIETTPTGLVDNSPSPQATEVETLAEAGASEATEFTANPCKGPSARFLSTCE